MNRARDPFGVYLIPAEDPQARTNLVFRAELLNAGNFASKTHSRNLLFLTQFGRRTTLSVAARRSRFDSSAAAGFRENALVGTAAMRF